MPAHDAAVTVPVPLNAFSGPTVRAPATEQVMPVTAAVREVPAKVIRAV